jgi:hypothetical protein
MTRLSLLAPLVAVLSVGCSTSGEDKGDLFDGDDGTGAGDGDGGGDAGDGGSDGGDGDGGDDGGGDDGDGVKFDTPDGTGGGGGDDETGCEKIDFLFIVDNSGSMSPHQQNLINNFGPFIDTIRDEVQGQDHQIMVLDTDACVDVGNGCADSCEETLGAGQVRSCAVPEDTRYMTSAMGIDTIKSAFQCAANVGDQGSAEELPMSAMMAALDEENAADGCNPGFVRSDAVLVVTFITDDHTGWFGTDDVSSVGSPQEWYDAVIAAKTKPENVVVLGLVALLSDQSCIGFGPEEADRFVEFIEMFDDHGIIGSVCTPDYNAFFQDAVALIDTACDEFVPEG